ncbi:zf-TFIIB domain-containing protein [Blastococcus saxobsidens]|uniref:Zf-TFIIB domain-containing protein n=1 Tax=Blastococcus saxobsidens TaxID=138336 RepID=A0A6L9VZ61_9ACTN|nr:zf-TFIIB domain-containing protein [Blastococcus saxobsidens]NEK84978.1 zf-TFIIB domain-containing protein [Blastococcus saxobsidens]
MELTCPKCHGTMRTYERNGVHVDQCTECRGIFLDRGELDRLIDAENAWHGEDAADRRPPAAPPSAGRGEHGREHSGAPQGGTSAAGLGGLVGEVLRQVQGSSHSSHSSHSSGGYKRKKNESFLGDLFG